MIDNIVKDSWLSEIIGKKTYKLIIDATLINQKDNFLHKWLKNLHGEKIFIYSKVPTNQLSHIHFLEKYGFRLVDTNVRLKKLTLLKEKVELSNNCKVRFTKQSDKEQVIDIAKNNFRFTRFHIDPAIDNSIANCIKEKWVANFYHGNRGDKMIVAYVGKEIAGFLLLIKDNEKLIIDLITVDSKYQRQKIASDMIFYAESNIDFSEFQVGTQIGNIPSVRLYENLGFKMYCSEYVFHFHQ